MFVPFIPGSPAPKAVSVYTKLPVLSISTYVSTFAVKVFGVSNIYCLILST